MRIFKFILLWTALTVVMMVSWPLGITLGDTITQSGPPPLDRAVDPSSVASAFLAVCIVNSFFLSLMVWKTRSYDGAVKWMSLGLYIWTVQFLLPQMETLFFV